MLKHSVWRRIPEAAVVSAALFAASACGGGVERVPVVEFTEGVETEVQEVAPNEWRIADERVVPDSNASRVIARGLDGTVDTFGLAELTASGAAPAAQDSTSQTRYRRRSGFSTILLYGLIGNRLGAARQGITPSPRAYVNQNAYNRVQSTAGTRLNNTGRRTTVSRPAGGRSGYGGGRSGRSYGG